MLLFLPEEACFLRRSLTPVVSRGSPCGHLGTPRRCLCLPPIPSIRMLVSAFAFPGRPRTGVQAHPARSLRAFLIPWPRLSGSPFLRLLPEEFGGGWGLGSSFFQRNGTQPAKWALD